MHSSRIASYEFVCFLSPTRLFSEWRIVVAVVADSVAVIVCGSNASGRVGTSLTNKFVLLRN